ncbi:MAG TPA: tetratricopeptide repeat protein [Methylocella sp.]|nr:tetratricopeptide repeat protein [Methylocella sp.]
MLKWLASLGGGSAAKVAAAIGAADAARAACAWPEAARLYREVLDMDGSLAPIWVQYGHALKESGNLSKAEAAYRKSIEITPQEADTHLQLGHALKLQGRTNEAAEAYEECLRRDPKSEHARLELLNLKLVVSVVSEHPYASWERETVVFIHLQKTAGKAFHALLEPHFASDRICPIPDNNLHLLSMAELGQFDFYSGHFDYFSTRFIPRHRIKTISLFRNPRARLISFYRFHRAHKLCDEFACNMFVRLANEFTAEEFFEHPEVRNKPEAFNNYLLAFGLSFAYPGLGEPFGMNEIAPEALERAKRQVLALDGIGITEHFDESAKLIFKQLNLPLPPYIKKIHVTDEFAEFDARFSRAEPVSMTPRLASALEDLTVYDDEIYRVALNEFERRREMTKAPISECTRDDR